MTVQKFSLVRGEPARLEVSWGWFWKNGRVTFEGQELARFEGLDALKKGLHLNLPDGSVLEVGYRQQPLGGGLVLMHAGAPVPGSAAEPIPKWAWFFAVSCAVIPFITGFGAVPGAIGFGGGAAVVALARNPTRTTAVRVALCAAITVGCWLALFALVVAVAAARRP